MRKHLLLLAVCLMSVVGYAQSNEPTTDQPAVIILKNETTIKAYDMEVTADGVKYKTSPDAGVTEFVPVKTIDLVLHKDGSIQKSKDFPRQPFKHGFEGHVGASLNTYFDCYDVMMGPGIDADFGYRVARPFYIGLGFGVHEYSLVERPRTRYIDLSVPLYLKMDIFLPSKNRRLSPYFDLAIGAYFSRELRPGDDPFPEYFVYSRVGFGLDIDQRHQVALGYNVELCHGFYFSYAFTFNNRK